MEKAELYNLDLTNVAWQKSSYSNPSGNCVEVGRIWGAVAVRDSKMAQKDALRFSASEWAAFRSGVKAGEL